MNAVVAESALRILNDHKYDGDAYLRAETQRLIEADRLILSGRVMRTTLAVSAMKARDRRFTGEALTNWGAL